MKNKRIIGTIIGGAAGIVIIPISIGASLLNIVCVPLIPVWTAYVGYVCTEPNETS